MWGALIPLVLALALSNMALVLLPGCLNTRDSGSTVTGRALSMPGPAAVPFIRTLIKGDNAIRFQVTDSNGSFTVMHVPKGSYTVKFARFGIDLYSQDLVIDEDEQTYIVNMPDLSTGEVALSGVVTDLYGPVEAAEVWLTYDESGLARAETDEEGVYRFEDLPAGFATLVCLAEDHLMRLFEDIYIGPGGYGRFDTELEVVPDYDGGLVFGVVQDSDGEPLDDAYVGIFPANAEPSLYMVAQEETLTVTGGYQLAEVPPGVYTVIATRSGYGIKTQDVVVQAFGEHRLDFVLDSDEEIWLGTNKGN